MCCEAASLFKMGSNITLHVCTVGKPPCPGADSSIKTAWAMEGCAERMMKLLAAWLEVFLCEMIYILTQSLYCLCGLKRSKSIKLIKIDKTFLHSHMPVYVLIVSERPTTLTLFQISKFTPAHHQ